MVLAGVPPETASTLAKVANPATGTKSVAGLKQGFHHLGQDGNAVVMAEEEGVAVGG